MGRVICGIVLWLSMFTAAAEWRVDTKRLFEDEDPTKLAIVEDGSGNSLRVYRDKNGTLWAIFALKEGFDTLADHGCPTYQVDSYPSTNIPGNDARCLLESKRAHFTLGDIDSDQVRSAALTRLMEGSSIALRYRLQPVGYGQTTFTLRGSRQALESILGDDVVILEE